MKKAQIKPDPQLIRAVGIVGLAAGIFNCTVGGGIFRLPGVVYEMAGAAAPLVYLICGLVTVLILLTFAIVGRRISKTGGPYAYVEEEFGSYLGFVAGLLVWLLGILSMASVATAFVDNVLLLLPIPIPMPTPAPILEGVLARNGILVAAFASLSFINVRGVEAGNRANIVMTVLKLIPLLILIAMAIPRIEATHIRPPTEFDFEKLARAAIVLMFAFTGVESALIPSGEVKDPKRTVPWALGLGLGGVILLYLALQIVTQGVLGEAMAEAKSAPLAVAAERVMGAPGRYLLLVGAVVSMFGYLSAMTLANPRALFAMGEKGILPRHFASVHKVYRSPAFAIVTNSILVCLLAITSSFEKLAIIANLSALLLYVLCALAAAKIQKGVPWVPVLTCVVLAGLLTSITLDEWLMVGSVLLVGSVGYYVSRRALRA